MNDIVGTKKCEERTVENMWNQIGYVKRIGARIQWNKKNEMKYKQTFFFPRRNIRLGHFILLLSLFLYIGNGANVKRKNVNVIFPNIKINLLEVYSQGSELIYVYLAYLLLLMLFSAFFFFFSFVCY